MKPKHYQRRAKMNVRRTWSNGHQSVLLVAPTGAGKTFMAVNILEGERVLWVAHRRELVLQAKEELERVAGRRSVGVIMAGEPAHPRRRIQVASLDTILRRKAPSHIDVVVVDEAHHIMADTYQDLMGVYPDTRVLGLTATPERDDGRPLGDVFERMVVAANYSELIENGDLVSVDVIRPTERLTDTVAMEVVDAWIQYSGHHSTFAFLPSVEDAKEQAQRFSYQANVRAEVVEANTSTGWRDVVIEQFRKGRVDVLCSVYTLAEGVDVPVAHVAVSSRPFHFVGTMLQCFGRVMRPAPGKERALVIDLTGATHLHGLPDDDREYSLTAESPIKLANRGSNGGSGKRRERFVDGSVGLEVATLGKPPVVKTCLPWAKPARRARIPDRKLRAIRLKHGRRVMEHAIDYYDSMEL